jgi:hypothetical protein
VNQIPAVPDRDTRKIPECGVDQIVIRTDPAEAGVGIKPGNNRIEELGMIAG